MDIIKTDQLLQFTLATAGQEDFENQELGPVHLIKYIYLADLEHAKHCNGITYTSLPWIFHHFGPWSNEAYLRIEPALQAIKAEKRIIENHEFDSEFILDHKETGFSGKNRFLDLEFIRWYIINDKLYNRLETQLPLIITTSIQKYVHEFNAITEDLLHFVYKTWPMLRAKPGDMLDFSIPDYIINENKEYNIPDMLSAKQKKKKRNAVEALKKEFRKKLEKKKRKPKLRFNLPLYDDVYYEGLKMLDSLAGEEIKTIKGIARFSDDIWKSKARFDPDVP